MKDKVVRNYNGTNWWSILPGVVDLNDAGYREETKKLDYYLKTTI